MRSAIGALTLAAALLAALLIGVGLGAADDGERAASSAGAAQPIELVAAIPDGYGQFFAVQWSGGSLRQLRAQLAVRGCIANTIFLYDDDRWYGYSSFDVPAALNSQFIDTYGSFVPSGTLWSDCADLTSRLGDPPPASDGLDLVNRPIVADIPGEYDRFFPLRWRGGSLRQLRAQLAVRGCIANTIVLYDDGRWHGYSSFDVPAALNSQFTETYGSFVPSGTLWADCADPTSRLGDAPPASDGLDLVNRPIVADIPGEYGRFFPFRWNGGSLYDLYLRLAIAGCIADIIVASDDQRSAYSRFSVPGPHNRRFVETYAGSAPVGALWADCVDLREVLGSPTATDATIGSALQPTQVIADVPDEYDRLFPVQYGGGSLYHLKARLATMGCMANTIILHDDGWRVYNQYHVGAALIQQFADDYAELVPAGTLWADCINICTYDAERGTVDAGRQCLSWEETRDENNRTGWFPFPIHNSTLCTDEFHPDVRRHLRPILPLFPNVCIARQLVDSGSGAFGTLNRLLPYALHQQSAVLIYIERGSRAHGAILQGNYQGTFAHEAHELCHVQQNYYDVQGYRPGQVRPGWFVGYQSDAARRFIELVGFRRLSNSWEWELPSDSIFRNIYSTNPHELSAELCSFYILNQAGVSNPYVPNMERYLTPEIVEWLEKYMVLPPIEE